MAQSLEDLKQAFAGESQANRKYLAFAKKAEEEGFSDVARLFRIAAEGETVHAHRHLSAMDGVGTTADNLKAALHGETEEFTSMYPAMMANAKEEGNAKALDSFEDANTIEKEHAKLYEKALENPADFKLEKAWVCQNCGHIHFGEEPPSGCDVCGFPTKFFKEIV